MIQHHPRRILLALGLLAGLCACAAPQLHYRIDGKLNVNATNDASTLPLLPFLVKREGERAFEDATYGELATDGNEEASRKPLAKKVLDGNSPPIGSIKLPSDLEGFEFVGVVGTFNTDAGNWRLLVPIDELKRKRVRIHGHSLELENRK
ncbi:MAG: type VI secretion lipoprotein TssJ [Planctomycetes bacterium]|nr:type VI secretion lipoprotein TssJ [Planctomycetota bacterium]